MPFAATRLAESFTAREFKFNTSCAIFRVVFTVVLVFCDEFGLTNSDFDEINRSKKRKKKRHTSCAVCGIELGKKRKKI